MGTSALTVLSTLLVLAGQGETVRSVAPAGAGTQPNAATEAKSDRLYGRVLTTDGASVEGFIRWNEGEVGTTDYLDGGRITPAEFRREALLLDPDFAARQKAERSIIAFGQRITWDEDDIEGDPLSEAALRFGHIRTLEPIDDRALRLTLVDGEEVEMRSLSSEIGRRMQRLAIERSDGEVVRVRWRELSRIDFLDVPTAAAPPASTRLHGTLTTASGLTLTGNVRWDLDETVGTDVLDGRPGVAQPDREIPFSEIARIEWASARSARVTLHDGTSVELRGTNDVNRQIRGIEVFDAGAGRVIVHWEDFESLRFHPPGATAERPASTTRSPGGLIRGTVYARDGRVIEGEVRWDNDESRWWEMLDGWRGDIEYGIEFGSIATITRLSEDAVAVTLLDGRTIGLEDMSDVDDRNRGIFVKPDGRPRRLVRWIDFERLELAR